MSAIADPDTGIREVVRFLNNLGFTVTESGDGVSKTPAELADDCEMAWPNVLIPTAPALLSETADYIAQALRDEGVAVVPLAPDGSYMGPCECTVSASYCVGDGVGLVAIEHLNDVKLAMARLICKGLDSGPN
jgi:hypothetical protein